jgi:hypothetical protein
MAISHHLKIEVKKMQKVLLLLTTVLIACSLSFAQDSKDDKKSAQPTKLTAEEVVAKHLASIGTPEDIAAAKTRVMVGTGGVSGKALATGSQTGAAQLASSGNMSLLAMIFSNANYPYEKVAYDGKEVTVGKFTGGGVSLLGEFIKRQGAVMREGLFTGALSSAWPLLNVSGNKVKLSYSGIAEISGQKFHKLKYTPRSGDLTIFLYFDTTNFHHVLTEYKFSVDVGASASSTEGTDRKVERWTMTEQFSNFKTVGKLTIPFNYSINTTHIVEDGLLSYDWKINISDVYLNETLDPAVFKVS